MADEMKGYVPCSMVSPGFEAIYTGRTSAETIEEADGAEGEFTDPSGNVCFKRSGSPAVSGATSATRWTTGVCTRSSWPTRRNSASASASGWTPDSAPGRE